MLVAVISMKFSVEFLRSLQTQHNNNCTRTGYRQTDRQRGARLLQGRSISDGDTRRVTVLLNTPHGNLISSLQSVLTGLSVFTARPSSSFLLHLPSSSSPSAAQQLVPCVLHWAVLTGKLTGKPSCCVVGSWFIFLQTQSLKDDKYKFSNAMNNFHCHKCM